MPDLGRPVLPIALRNVVVSIGASIGGLAKNPGFVFEHVALNLNTADDQRVIRGTSNNLEGLFFHVRTPSPRLMVRSKAANGSVSRKL